ncbi:metalloregulator ArsR/SmtB family transcription factor [Streptomyces sp. NPDC097619]|uniref:ArsR/SmtB family transcription factor n=1 Tax=Streptomyces sp. NPDC097619 TaxID=3157228 RepID=UPI003331F078
MDTGEQGAQGAHDGREARAGVNGPGGRDGRTGTDGRASLDPNLNSDPNSDPDPGPRGDVGPLLTEEAAAAVAEVMQGLSAPARVRILDRLLRAPCSVGDLAADLALGQPTVSNHLRLLRHLGLVAGHRAGRSVIYGLRDEHVAELLRQVLAHVHHDLPQ